MMRSLTYLGDLASKVCGIVMMSFTHKPITRQFNMANRQFEGGGKLI